MLAGLAALASVALGARALRRRFLGGLDGPPALLADGVGVLTITILVSELLGVVGAFRFYALAPALVLSGALAWWLATRSYVGASGDRTNVADVREAQEHDVTPPRGSPIARGVAIAAIGVLAADWLPRLVHVYRTGPTTIDTMWYHLPIAARFAQTGSLLDVPIIASGASLPSFYPHTSELLHATGIVFLTNDTLTPILNLLWLGVALFAAWCIGRAFGVAPLALTAVAAVLGGPQLVIYEAGQGLNDLLGVAMTLAAVALLVNTWSRHLRIPGALVAGMAMGIAMGSKFTVAGPAFALTVCVIVFCASDIRLRVGGLWLAGLILTGAFWYLRNLFAVGNPVPATSVSIGPIDLPHLHLAGVSSPWSHLPNGGWSKYLAPGFRYALGPPWWALLLVMCAGFVAGSFVREQRIRLIAISGLLSAVIFVFSPQSLGYGHDASFFAFNVRYLAIPMVLGATALATAAARYGTHVINALAIGFAAILLAAQFDDKLWPFHGGRPAELGLPALSRRELALGIAAGIFVTLATLVALAYAAQRQSGRSSVRTSSPWWIAGTVVVVISGLLVLQHVYLERRYRNAPYLTKTFAWARDTRDKRIGLVGTFLQYPLTGNDVSNREEQLEHRTSDLVAKPIADCRTWRETVNRKRLDYVLVTTIGYPAVQLSTAREQTWMATDPAARLVLTDRNGKARAWLYAVHGRLDPSRCPSSASSQMLGAQTP